MSSGHTIDERYMTRALQLAAKTNPSPNPKVGCVIVKQGKIISDAYHHKAGSPHAEILALRRAGKQAQGATMYVTLEPCCHQGKTPPCTDTIIKAGIRRVVAAMRDPNNAVDGKGFARLVNAGINVKYNVLNKEAQELNKHWLYYITKKRPYVMMKIAQTLDGKVCTTTGDSKWITGTESRAFVHRLRGDVDAVLVGINTVLKDDPRLTAHGKGKDPLRVILDSRLRIPLDARVLKDRNCMILTKVKQDTTTRRKITAKGVTIVTLRDVRWRTILTSLAEYGVTSLLIEGGAEVFTSAFEQNAVNEAYWFIAPKVIGGERAKTAIEGKGIRLMRAAAMLDQATATKIGADLCIHGHL